MEPLKLAVVGVGALGRHHARILSQMPGVKLVAVADPNVAQAQSVAENCGCEWTPDYRTLLQRIDAASIVVPTFLHKSVASEFLQRSIPVLVEKPLAGSVDDGGTLVRLADEHKIPLQVGHIERFNPAILALDGYDIRPMFVESHRLSQFNPRSTDVDVVLDLMIHDIDIIVSLVGSGVDSVDASGVAVVSETLDIANARLRFANGCIANVTASRISQKKMRRMRLFQKDAYISVDFLEGESEVFRLLDGPDTAGKGTKRLGEIETGTRKRTIVYQKPKIRKINPLGYELGRFVDAIALGVEPPVTGEDGLRALGVAHMIIDRIGERKLPS